MLFKEVARGRDLPIVSALITDEILSHAFFHSNGAECFKTWPNNSRLPILGKKSPPQASQVGLKTPELTRDSKKN